ncbi:MAG: hypothetical protein A2167_05610 [Planctomycetes bacterium RBG_13_46_10]|nr:MAG: hypothetical protein A2167_05610 [Planctomycetes bacterium RBG_13_46_10]
MQSELNKTKLMLAYILAVVILILLCCPLLIGADYMYWDDYHSFADIVLDKIQTRDQIPEGSSWAILCLNGDAEITADHTAIAQLTKTTDTLVTEYKLEYDKNGTNGTGGTPPVDWAEYDVFLPGGSTVTYVPGDNEVTVTLHVRASNSAGELADAGSYIATQTLTVHWK